MNRNPKFMWQESLTRARDLTPSAFKVGMEIANRWNGGQDLPYAGAEGLSHATGYSLAQVKRALKELRAKGWIEQVYRGGRRGDGWVSASRWRLTIPVPQGVMDDTPQGVMGDTPLDQ